MSTHPALDRVVIFANGKGGVGKTTCAVNVAGMAAAAGTRTLLIDLDPQGNAGQDLGYFWAEAGDEGEHLVNTLVAKGTLAPVLTDVRPGLDVIPGGSYLDDLEDVLAGRSRRQEDTHRVLADALGPLAADYDLVVIDTPPTRPTLLQLALGATRWVVIPTRSDRGSIEGLRRLAATIAQSRTVNPDLDVLGACLFATGASATTIRRDAAQDIQDVLGGAGILFEAVIRYAEGAANAGREQGQLVHELAESVQASEPWWAALRDGRRPKRLPGSAPALAEDFALLTHEILTRIAHLEAEQEQSA
jgi:chromosome partitioning protein